MDTIEELAQQMEYFNADLIESTGYDNSNIMRRIKDLERSLNKGVRHGARAHEVEAEEEEEAETNLIGQKPTILTCQKPSHHQLIM